MSSVFRLSEFEAVIFDWDGVLVDSGRNYYRAYELVLAEIGIPTTPREIYLREGQPTPQVIAALCAERGISLHQEQIAELVVRRREYDAAQGKREFFPGVWEMIEYLRRAKCKVGMVTGSSRKSVQLLLTSDLERRFDVVTTADDVVRGKPDPEPFMLAATKMRVAPTSCVVVENAPFGIQAARAAGCRVIALCTTLSLEDLRDADWVVKNHAELEALFAQKNEPVRSAG